MLRSILGGRWSDQALHCLIDANDGHYFPDACSSTAVALRAALLISA